MGSNPGQLIRQRILAAFDGMRHGDTLTRDDLARMLQRAHTTVGNATDHLQREGKLVNMAPRGSVARYCPAHAVTPGMPTQKSKRRQLIEQFVQNNPGTHTIASIADALQLGENSVRSHVGSAAMAGDLVNTTPGCVPAHYTHREHWQQNRVVTRRDPITNAGMPNGSRAYWQQHMAAFNEPPRTR